MKIRWIVGAAAMLCAAVLCTGCSDTPQDASGESSSFSFDEATTEYVMMTISGKEASSIVDAVPELPASSAELTEATDTTEGTSQPAGTNSPFEKGVYLGRATDWTERFFCFNDGLSGNCLAQEDGAVTAFTLVADGTDKAVFHIGEATISADLFWTDDKNVMLLWEDGVSETLTKISDEPAGFKFYSSEALCNKALDVYAQKSGYRPTMADAVLNADDTISIKLYDEVDGHTATCDWYTVNRYTGIGSSMLGDPIDLSDGSNPQVPNTTEATRPTETQPVTEPTEPTQPTT